MQSRRFKILGLVLILNFALAVASAQPGATPPSAPKEIKPGQAITQAIWKDTRFVFAGKAGEVVTLKVTGKDSGLDPHVALLNPKGDKEASDDDSGGHGNSLIKNHPLIRTGRYTVVVGLAEGQEGEIEILLKKTTPKTKTKPRVH